MKHRVRIPWSLRRLVHVRRRTLAALAAGLAVLALLAVFAPPRAELTGVVAAARDLPGGTVLAASDLTTVELPAAAVPAGALPDAAAAVGLTLNGPLSARSPVTETSVAAGQGLARPGHVIVALPLANQTLAPLVTPGVRLDLLDSGSGEALATDVRVVAVPESQASGFGSAPSRAALVEVLPEIATRLAVAAQSGGVAIALR